jgi:hypothetical protein
MANRSLLLVVALALLSVLGVMLLWEPNDSGLLDEQSSSEEFAAADREFGGVTAEPNAEQAFGKEAGLGERQVDQERMPNLAPARVVRLEIYQDSRQDLQAGARVYYITKDYLQRHAAELEGFYRRDPWAFDGLESLPMAVANSDGMVELEVRGDIFFAYAKIGSARGYKAFKLKPDSTNAQDLALVLQVFEFEEFAIHVLDPDGHPAANVPVKLMLTERGYPLPVESAKTTTTNIDGIAIIDIPKAVLGDVLARITGPGTDYEFVAEAQLPFLGTPAARFASVESGNRELSLVLPKYGSVEVRSLNLPMDQALYLKCKPVGRLAWRPLTEFTEVEPGEFRVDYISMNQWVQLGVRDRKNGDQNDPSPRSVKLAEGPSIQGQVVRMEWDFLHGSFLAGRLLAENSSPVAGREFNLILMDFNGCQVAGALKSSTTAEGKFRVEYSHGISRLSNANRFRIRLSPRRRPGIGSETTITDYSGALIPGWEQRGALLGDLYPKPGLPMVSGTVVDGPNGQAIPWAEVFLSKTETMEKDPEPRAGAFGGHPYVPVIEMEAEMRPRPSRDCFAVYADEVGRFKFAQGVALLGTTSRIGATAEGYAWTVQEFQYGQEGLEIGLYKKGSVQYSLDPSPTIDEPDEIVSRGELMVKLHRQEMSSFSPLGSDSEYQSFPGWGTEPIGGPYTIADVAPGVYTWTLTDTHHTLLIETRDVVVLPGQVTLDPRLQNVKLFSGKEFVSLKILNGDGKPLSAKELRDIGSISVEHRYGSRQFLKTEDMIDSKLTYSRTKFAPTQIRLGASGYQEVTLAEVEDGDSVRLKKLLRLTIQVIGLHQLPINGQLNLVLVEDGPTQDPYSGVRYSHLVDYDGRVHRDGKLSQPIYGPGKYECHWWMRFDDQRGYIEASSTVNLQEQHLANGLQLEVPSELIELARKKAN